ncbi:ABC transporter [Corynebacterium parakroppenstedtii]|nr:ABC transporter [Corynebacterium kroppenstedtii]
MIDVHRISKSYGSKSVVRGMSVRLRDGEVTCLLGPNGAGKSTLLSAMAGLIPVDSGRILVDGASLRASRNPLRSVSSVLDRDAVHPARTARAHLRWVARCCGMPLARADALLSLVGLQDVAGKRADSFSLGMRQRLAVAAALMPDAQNLLLDEPINGLDVDGIMWMRELFSHLASMGRCVVVSSHLLSEVEKVADRVLVIGRGQVLADGGVGELNSEYGDLEKAYVALTRSAVKYGKVASSCF